ncbi:hypothetical protein J2S17_003520 [Cytobacillus purgationiresistens]|uniref:Uncharacterized protein n=1 Tax=Cytobacillus purgationiresistens TaxID=863449 RepID=A0ABU0AK36_9BACI|nr:hypothetical protein [Cytobacillus purgationiresistens]
MHFLKSLNLKNIIKFRFVSILKIIEYLREETMRRNPIKNSFFERVYIGVSSLLL